MSESAKQAPQKPVPPPLAESSQLPHELTDLPRWVAWLYDWRGGPHWSKQPYTPATGQWKGWQKGATTFEEACKGAVKFHGDGVGFKPEPDDPFVLIDFDDCVMDGVLDPVVTTWLKWFPTYTEISPSGHGLRLVVKGHLPRTITNTKLPGSDKASVELYDGHSGRYVTITGNHWGEPHLEIEEDQIGIDKLLTAIGYDPTKVPGTAAEDNDKPTTLEQICAVYEKHLEKFRSMKLATDSQNDQLNICALIAARGFLAGAFEQTEEELKSELRAIALSSGHCPGVDRTLDSGWDSGIEKGPFKIQEDRAKEALKYLDDFLADPDAAKPSLKELADVCADAEPEEVATRKKELAKRLKVTVKDFDAAVGAAKRRVAQDPKRRINPADLTVEIVKKIVEHLLDHDPDEAAKKAAEDVIGIICARTPKFFAAITKGTS